MGEKPASDGGHDEEHKNRKEDEGYPQFDPKGCRQIADGEPHQYGEENQDDGIDNDGTADGDGNGDIVTHAISAHSGISDERMGTEHTAGEEGCQCGHIKAKIGNRKNNRNRADHG